MAMDGDPLCPSRPTDASLRAHLSSAPLAALTREAATLRDAGHGDVVTYSRKVFIPLTRLCRDVCHYCTFARPPRADEPPYLSPDAVLAIAGTGAATASLMRSARRLGMDDRIVLLGHVADRAHLATLMATADCFVHPNPAEPFGLCPLEALAAGCRVVAPDAAGTAELLRGRGAVLVGPDDPVAIARGVREALTRPRPRPDMEDLSWDRTFAREWSVYAMLASAA